MNPFNENKHKLETLKLNIKKTVFKDLFDRKLAILNRLSTQK